MKKLLVLVLALIAVIGVIFAVSASAADPALVSNKDIVKLYESNGTEVVGGGMNGGSYIQHAFDGSYGSLYNNTAGRYAIIDLNAALAGGYYVTDIKIYHAGNTNYSVYYTSDGATWKPVAENAKVAGCATYVVNDYAVQVKYVFETVIGWTPSLQEIEVYGLDPKDVSCSHSNMSADAWVAVEGSATCTEIGKQSQACPDCGEVLYRESAEVAPLGHDLSTVVTKEGTDVSYGEGIIQCSRCDYAIDFKGEVDLTDSYYAGYGETLKFVSINVSSIGHQSWGSKAEYLTDNGTAIGWGSWYAETEDDANEWVRFDFMGELDLTKIDIWVPNDGQGTLYIYARNMETGEYEVVKELGTYDENLETWAALPLSISMLGVTTDSVKFQIHSPSSKHDGFLYGKMCIAEVDVYAIAPGCGLDAENHEHAFDTFVGYVTAPTCSAAGTATYKCACNETTVVPVDASEDFHDYVEVEGTRVNSTCTTPGSYTGKCSICEAEDTIILELDGENGHSFSTELSRTDADCENAGEIVYGCDFCEATKTEVIEALGHAWGEAVIVPADCVNAGSSTKTCATCGETLEEEIPVVGHTWTVESYVTEPTCGAAGEANYVCSVCSETKVDVAEATGNHIWDEENYTITMAPTCEGTGTAKFTCTVCGNTKLDVVAALGHDFSVEVEGTRVDATCTKEGSVDYKCANCDKVKEGVVLPMVEHTNAYDESYVYVASTCKEAGYEQFVCTVCAQTIKTDFEIDTEYGHEYDDGVRNESDTGIIYTCALCGNTNEVITLGTNQEPIEIVVGENTAKVPVAEAEDVWYYLPVTTYGKYTLTIANGEIGVKHAANAMALFRAPFTFEQTVYEIVVDPDNGNQYPVVFTSNVKDTVFTVAFEEMSYPSIEVGDNALIGSIEGGKYVVSVPGDYVLSAMEGEENAAVNISYVHPMFGATTEMVDLPYAFTVAEGETVKFVINTADWSEEDEINLNLHMHENPYDESYVYIPASCVADGSTSYVCACGETVSKVLPLDPESHNYDDGVRNEADTGVIYTCADCGTSYETITKGTNMEPIAAVIGDNAVTIFNAEAEDIWYYLPVTEYGKYTITVADTVGVKHAPNAMALFRQMFTFGQTTYEIVVDPDNGSEYPVVFTSNVETFNVAFEAMEYPTINLGDNALVGSASGNKYVVNVAGEYILSAAEGEENAVVNVSMIHPMFGAMTEMVDLPYTFTVAEGESIKFIINTADWSEEDEINLVLSPAHVHVEEVIPAILPTPTVTGYTAGVKCADCDEVLVAPKAINVTKMENTKDPNFRIYSASLSAKENISVNYNVVTSEGYNNAYMVFVFTGKEYIVTDYTVNPSNGRLVFNFAETFPQLMGENIEAYVYAETAEGEYSRNEILTYSVKQYVISQLKKNTPALTTVMSDILTMGAKTQLYMNYKTNELVTDLVKAEGYTLTPTTFEGIPADVFVQAVTGDRTTGVDWKSGTLAFGASTEVILKLAADNIDGLIAKIEVAGQTREYNVSELEIDGGNYKITLDWIKSFEYNETITATFERNGVQVGSTLTYSINSFLYRNYEKASYSEAARELMKALYIYGESISAYFA